MKSLKSRQHRGVTLLEVLATMVVLLVGVGAAMAVVTQTSRSNRRTLTATQAQIIAERELEDIIAMGCSTEPPCGNLRTLDRTRRTVWQTASGELKTTQPTGVQAREYEVSVDVDSGVIMNSIENNAPGEPPVTRNLANNQPGNVANVRVSVSWREPGRQGRQVVVLQTRMAP
jgi:prepilin-type N-terminal cleavage/methylation domain-containing protein